MYTYDRKPAGGFSVKPGEIYKALHEYQVQLAEQDEMNKTIAESAAIREQDEARAAYNEYISASAQREASKARRSQYLQTVKEAFLSECLLKLFKESFPSPMTKQDTVVAKNLIHRFVRENGAGTLINDFRTKNLLLSEFSRICEKNYNKILEAKDKDEDDVETDELGFLIGRPLKIDNTIGSEFFEDLEDIDCGEASKMIKDKVADSVSEFIDSNIAQKLDYEEVLNAAKDQSAKTTEEAQIEYINNRAKRYITESEMMKEKSVFHCIVESLTKSVFKDPELKQRYVNEATVDMEGIVNSAQLFYTMLEMANTTNMVKIDAEFLDDYLKSLE